MLKQKLKSVNARLYPRRLFYAPEWLVLGVNNICNLHCKMCDVGVDYNKSNFYQNLMGSRPVNMPVDLIRRIIEQAARYFPSVKLGYAFTEPLIYPHLMESLFYASAHNLYTAITTNALNLKRYADGILDAGLGDLFISLDGPEEIHNHIRGHKRSFQKALEGMEYVFSKEKRPGVSVFCVITEWNIGHLVDFARFFRDMPLEQLGFMHTNYTPQHVADRHNHLYGAEYAATASNMEEISVGNMDMDLLFEEIQAIRKLDLPFPVTFSPEINSRERLEVFYHHPEILMGKRCNDVFSNVMIKSDGTLIPAHGRCYNVRIGNLYEQDLRALWNSGVLADFRATLNKGGGLLPACSRCCSAF